METAIPVPSLHENLRSRLLVESRRNLDESLNAYLFYVRKCRPDFHDFRFTDQDLCKRLEFLPT